MVCPQLLSIYIQFQGMSIVLDKVFFLLSSPYPISHQARQYPHLAQVRAKVKPFNPSA